MFSLGGTLQQRSFPIDGYQFKTLKSLITGLATRISGPVILCDQHEYLEEKISYCVYFVAKKSNLQHDDGNRGDWKYSSIRHGCVLDQR
jgi:hypothetical protein